MASTETTANQLSANTAAPSTTATTNTTTTAVTASNPTGPLADQEPANKADTESPEIKLANKSSEVVVAADDDGLTKSNNNNKNNNKNNNNDDEQLQVNQAPQPVVSSVAPGHDHYPLPKPKVKLNKWQSFKLFLWNPETHKCMGRTPVNWARLVAFYITLYTCLAAIWSVLFYLFHLTVSERYPKWQLDESIIGVNPGVGFRPQNPTSRVESALIAFKQGNDGDYQEWVDSLHNYIRPYENRTMIKSLDCSADKKDRDSVCLFDTTIVPSECSVAQNFSFHLGKPCLLIKLNRIYGWKPDPYDTKPANYPPGAPFVPGHIQITCDGQHDPDKEHIGPLEYYPQGIDTKYYPFYNQPGYQSPFVMVHFKNPRHDMVIYVECKAWAKNIQHDRYNRRGMTSFEVFIESDRSMSGQQSR